VEETTEPYPSNITCIDTFLENTRLRVLETKNEELQRDIERYKDRCEDLRRDIGRLLDERNIARSKITVLRKDIDELEEKLSQETKKFKTEIDSIEKEYQHKLNESRSALKDSKRHESQKEQDNERLKQKIEKLEEMLASEHDRSKEYKFELEQIRGGMMFPHYPMAGMLPQFMHPHMHGMPPFPKEANEPYMQSAQREADQHYASKEHPTKRRAVDSDLRELISNPKSLCSKRLCYFGENCKHLRQYCNFAHSIDELKVCTKGKDCGAKIRCGYMIHSEDDRHKLRKFIKSSGKYEAICEAFDKDQTCKKGELCKKIHDEYF